MTTIRFGRPMAATSHFAAFIKGETGIYIVPAVGGAERKVRDTHWEEREFYEVFWYFGRLSWSPDGKLLRFRIGHPATNLLPFFSYHSIHSSSQTHFTTGCRVTTTLHFPPMVEHWHSTGDRRG